MTAHEKKHSENEQEAHKVKRKLLIATDNFLPRYDGISRFLGEVIPVLRELFDVTVVCPNFGPVEMDEIKIVQLPLSNWRVGDYQVPKFAFKSVAELVKEHDLVFTQGIGPIGWAAIRAAHKKKNVVLFMHSIEWELVPKAIENTFLRGVLPPLVKWWARRQYEKCDLVLCPSEGVSEMLLWNKIDVDKRVVHLGVNPKEFTPPKSKEDAKKALGISPEKFVVGYHGRISPEKDPKTLLRAFIRIRDANLLIVGSGVSELERSLKRRDVIMVGAQKNVVPYLQAMDAYVMPSLTETTCLSVLEAMSCGLPVVSTPVGYVRDYIESGSNGVLVPKQDAYAVARQLRELQQNSILRDRLGGNARKTVEQRFTWDKTRARVKQIFEGL